MAAGLRAQVRDARLAGVLDRATQRRDPGPGTGSGQEHGGRGPMISHRASWNERMTTDRAIAFLTDLNTGFSSSSDAGRTAKSRAGADRNANGIATSAAASTGATPTPVLSAAVPPAVVGRWYQHDALLVVKADGTFTWSSSAGVSAPTATVDGTVHGIGPASASGTVTSSTQPQRVGGTITMTVDQSHDTVTLTGPGASPSGAPVLPFCGPSAPSRYCGA